MEERDNEDWKENDSVNIRIPLANVLDENSTKEIYELFKRRFEQGAKMQNTHGIKYGLPVISDKDFQYDFTDVNHLKRFLKQNGYLFLNNHDFDILYQAIIRIPSIEIKSDKELSILAIVAYSEAAQYAESELFISKVKKSFNLTDDERVIVTFQSLKNNLQLGYINTSDFISKLNEINLPTDDSTNVVTIKINILRYKLLEAKSFDTLPNEFEIECQNIFDLIEKCNCSERFKKLFKIWNSEIEAIIFLDILRTHLAEVMLKETLGAIIPVSVKFNQISIFISAQSKFLNRLNEIYKWALEKEDKVLQGNVLSTYVTHFIQKEMVFISTSLDFAKYASAEHQEEVKKNYGFALWAYNCFLQMNMLKEAHYNLCNAIEILFEGEMLFNLEMVEDKTNLLSIKDKLEKESDIQPYEFQIPKLISRIKENDSKNNNPNMAFTKDLTDRQLQYIANTALESFSLPTERLTNIINELMAYRLFNQRCQDDNIQVFQVNNFNKAKSDFYKYPIQFVLRSKLTGIETAKSANMDELLKSWNL